MMTADKDLFLWKTNKDWYRFNEETGDFELTDKAPKEAIESFKKLKEREKVCL